MTTKIVYVLVSTEKDIYLEQAWASIYSLQYYNDNVNVVVVCDDRTATRINEQGPEEFRKICGTVVSVPFEEIVSNRERSRWLKTNLRSLVTGDFLFLDTDTIVTDSLVELDSFEFDLGMVYAWHCKMVDRPNKNFVKKRVKQLFNIDLRDETDYFNSGVIYCKDTEGNHRFFKRRHEYWLMAKDKPKGIQDQQSLIVTVNELGGVYVMSGDYNCQPVYSMKHIATAKIVHFFNLKWDNHEWSPFCTDDFYLDIKSKGYISEEKKQIILSCRSTFISPALCIFGDDINVWRSAAFSFLRKLYKNHMFFYNILNKSIARFVNTKVSSF